MDTPRASKALRPLSRTEVEVSEGVQGPTGCNSQERGAQNVESCLPESFPDRGPSLRGRTAEPLYRINFPESRFPGMYVYSLSKDKSKVTPSFTVTFPLIWCKPGKVKFD